MERSNVLDMGAARWGRWPRHSRWSALIPRTRQMPARFVPASLQPSIRQGVIVTLDERRGAGPISGGVCEAPGGGGVPPADRVLREMRSIGITATELGAPGFLPNEA